MLASIKLLTGPLLAILISTILSFPSFGAKDPSKDDLDIFETAPEIDFELNQSDLVSCLYHTPDSKAVFTLKGSVAATMKKKIIVSVIDDGNNSQNIKEETITIGKASCSKYEIVKVDGSESNSFRERFRYFLKNKVDLDQDKLKQITESMKNGGTPKKEVVEKKPEKITEAKKIKSIPKDKQMLSLKEREKMMMEAMIASRKAPQTKDSQLTNTTKNKTIKKTVKNLTSKKLMGRLITPERLWIFKYWWGDRE
jgi:hypothetical protein